MRTVLCVGGGEGFLFFSFPVTKIKIGYFRTLLDSLCFLHCVILISSFDSWRKQSTISSSNAVLL